MLKLDITVFLFPNTFEKYERGLEEELDLCCLNYLY